jgi:Fe-S cluster assembly ATP-binding protein
MLELRHVDVSAGATTILWDVNLTIGAGELHVLFGPNSSGKSCKLATIMGLPPFVVAGGEILFRGQRIDQLR